MDVERTGEPDLSYILKFPFGGKRKASFGIVGVPAGDLKRAAQLALTAAAGLPEPPFSVHSCIVFAFRSEHKWFGAATNSHSSS